MKHARIIKNPVFYAFVFLLIYDILLTRAGRCMTGSEFQKKVIELLHKYRLSEDIREKIFPLFSIVDNLSQDEIINVYSVLEEAITTQKETERLAKRLREICLDFNSSMRSVSHKLADLKKKLENLKAQGKNSGEKKELRKKVQKDERAMQYNKQSFPGEKPNFGLKLNKLFSSFITEYGPEHITMVISDSILYANSLILRISLKTHDVLIGSSKSLKLYETKNRQSFLVTDKPEVIPYGNKRGFYFKYITYEDILNLTNGDFYKVFTREVVDTYKSHEIGLPDELKGVGYYNFE